MHRLTPLLFASLALLAFTFASCGGGGGDGGDGDPGGGVGAGLSVSAGPDLHESEGELVTLSATTPTDPAGTIYQWVQVSGPTVALSGATTSSCSFTAPEAGIGETVVLELQVTATRNGVEASDTVMITIAPLDVILLRGTDLDPIAIYRADAGTGELLRISPSPASGQDIGGYLVSPDGRHVAYALDADVVGVQEVFVSATDGSGTTQVSGNLPAFADAAPLGWSPDGSKLAFRADATTDDAYELFTVRPDGTDRTRCHAPFNAGETMTRATWAPDGSRIAYRATQGGIDALRLFSSLPDGSGNTELSASLPAGTPRGLSLFSWAPDASAIAYTGDFTTAATTELYVVVPTGGVSTKKSGPLVSGGNVRQAYWSPDSTTLAYVADQDVDRVEEIFATSTVGAIIKLNGTLPAGSRAARFHGWAPDGSRILYASDERVAGVEELFSVRPDGSGWAQVSTPITSSGRVSRIFARWLPDSAGVLYAFTPDVSTAGQAFWITSPTGTEQTRISTSANADDLSLDASLSPDGAQVAWRQFDGAAGISAAWVAGVDGTNPTQVSPSLSLPALVDNQPGPTWSPDGAYLFYGVTSNPRDSVPDDLIVVAADGTGAQSIAGTPPGTIRRIGPFAEWLR